jgi:hypothetical protein
MASKLLMNVRSRWRKIVETAYNSQREYQESIKKQTNIVKSTNLCDKPLKKSEEVPVKPVKKFEDVPLKRELPVLLVTPKPSSVNQEVHKVYKFNQFPPSSLISN